MSAPFRLGLTGSVGMGKSTTATLFTEAGVPVWDADSAVHGLYAPGGPGAAALADLAPGTIRDGGVDRDCLRAAVLAEPGLLERIEARIHPLVAADRLAFAAAHAEADVILFDIPLLYETGAEQALDAVLVVTAPAAVQRARVMARPGMSEEMLERILARQLPDAEKRRRADFIIHTERGIEAARADVCALLAEIRRRRSDA